MKRTLVVLAALVAVVAAAVLPPAQAPLPNFDRRTDHAPAVDLAPQPAEAAAALAARVPQLQITSSKVSGSPSFFASRDGFLTGPDAEGRAVQAITARAFAKDDPHRAVKAFLTEHAGLIGYDAGVLNGAKISRDYITAHNGMRTVIWQQMLENIPVFDALTMGHITKDGELVNLYTDFVPDVNLAAVRGLKGRAVAAAPGSTRLSAVDALIIAAGSIGDEATAASLVSRGAAQGTARKEAFAGSGVLKGDQYAELVWLPLNANTLRLCWQAIVFSKARGEGFLCVVDAETGEVVLRRGLTHYISPATYNVYVSDSPSPFSPGHPVPSTVQPPVVNRQLVVTSAFSTNASPNGWINDGVNETTGNNVDAHTDRNDDDQPDLPRPQGNPNRVFDFPVDLTQEPTTYSPAAVVQLFYLNNVIHDRLWELGFTEAAGNFQVDNFGRGGAGGDAVSADAQDGGGFNNANMATPPDGIPPRMQMYLFNGPTPDRDGDFDAEVVIHEYMHGLSNRRVGGGVGISQLQTAGMGEGWGDFYAVAFLAEPTDPIDGNWASGGYIGFDFAGLRENYYFGDRHYPYSTNLLKNPYTFKDIDPTQASPHAGIPRNSIYGPFSAADAPEVHNQGEIWCVTLFEVRANLIAKYGQTNGNQIALQLVTDAMSLCPINPNFLQSRDAILLADRVNNNNANYNELWRAFAKRGMGSSATSPNSSTTQGVRESYDFPGLSIVTTSSSDGTTGNGNESIDPNECVEVFINLRNNSVTNAVGITGVLSTTTPGVTVVQAGSSFPNLVPNAIGQNLTPFRIYTSPSFVCGTRIELTLLATGFAPSQQTTTNTFTLRTGFVSLNPVVLNNSTPVNIPDANTNGVLSSINVAGLSGALGKVSVSLHIAHSAVGDLVIELIGPDGTTVALAKNQGADGDNYGTACTPFSSRTTFDDNAPFAISVANPPYVGTFRPDVPLVVFEGKSGAAVNGTWKLRVADFGAADVGALQCWSLSLFPTVCTDGGGPCASDLVLTATATPAPALVGQNLTYDLTVTNARPISGTAVVLTNVLPAGVTFISATSSVGACVFSNGTVRCNFGVLSTGSNVTARIVVQPNTLGQLTNKFTVGGSTADANPPNNTVTVISSVNVPAPSIVADGAQLIGDATGGIEAGETVTVNLTLRNAGSAATVNLVATLLNGNGVGGSSGSQNYGAIGIGASATQPFTFTAPGNAGETISAHLQLQDGVQNLGTVTFQFTLGGEMTFASGAEIIINQFGPASPYPATINVSGVAGAVGQARVTFTKLSHTFPDDIDALLVGPLGQKVVLMSDAGGGNAIVNQTISFDASASGPLPNEGTIVAGNYLPSNYTSGTEPGGDIFPAPAPSGEISSLASFNGTSPNGTWSLYIHDDGGNDGGSISGGWSLGLTIVVPVKPLANLSITANAAPNPAVVGEPLTYTLTVANSGPSNAASVVVTDTIPAGTAFVSAIPSQGTATESAGVVTANLGTINSGANATVTITVTPTSTGAKSNQASVSGDVTDLEPGNNSVTTIVNANNPVADLAVSASAAPSPVFVSSNVTFHIVVTNRGPNHADAVQVTNRLAPLLAFVSATNSQGGCVFADGVVTCDFGSLPANGSATATIEVTALIAGDSANLFALVSPTTDPVAVNNTTNLTVTVNPLAPLIVSSGAALTGESVVPANGSIESGETVTISFGLRNVGTLDAGNLVATLLGTGGVSGPSGPQAYGAIVANGPTVSRSFSFTAATAAGGTFTATLQLQDGAQDLGTVSLNFNISSSQAFTNSDVIIIPLAGQASSYPSTITVAGVAGTVSKVTVSLRQFTHTFPEDVDVLLVGPGGQKVMLMSDAGAGNGVNGITLTFDAAGGALPFSTVIAGGTYRPTDYPPGDILPSPAPEGPYGTNLSAFNAVDPNGTWSLYVFDDANGDSGRIDGGWTLNIQTATPIVPSADVAVTATAPASIVAGASFNYAITVANHGPAAATGVVMTDTLPAGFTLGSVSVSQGSYTTGAGLVTANLGTLASGATAFISISGSGAVNLTNLLSVLAAQADVNPANNSLSVVTLLTPPTLSIRVSGINVLIAWPAPSTGYVLESSSSVSGPWAAAGLAANVVGGENQVTVPAVGTVFYRLRKP